MRSLSCSGFVVTSLVGLATVVLSGATFAGEPDRKRVVWESRGQSEFGGSAQDIDGAGSTVVAASWVFDETFSAQWMVRAMDRKSGQTLWEDRYGPMTFGSAKDVAVDGHLAFVAGWTLLEQGAPEEHLHTFEFVVRAYDLHTGVVAWTQAIGLGPQCVEEQPGFARCVAKALVVHDGRVFVVGHLTGTAARSDFAVLAFDASTGVPLWESVTDPTGTGANDYAWGVVARGNRVFVVGEIGDLSGLLLQAHDTETGAIRWQRQVPGARNYTLKDTIAAGPRHVFIGGVDAENRLVVQAYDARTGALRWDDRAGDGLCQLTGLAIGGGERGDDDVRLFATGVVGCDPATFADCELAIRAYDPRRGLLWERLEVAPGGDWYADAVAAADGTVFVAGRQLLEDGEYQGSVRAYSAGGAFKWTAPFEETSGNGLNSFISGLLAQRDGLFVAGNDIRPDGGADFLVRKYRTRRPSR